jgi:hypothetical protein
VFTPLPAFPPDCPPFFSALFNIQELKTRCKSRGLEVGGKKRDLIERLKSGDKMGPLHPQYVLLEHRFRFFFVEFVYLT